jgi:hypothetical protein
MAEEQKNTITVDGKEYDSEALTDNAKKLITNIQYADQELNRLRMLNAAVQTARQSYIATLKNELEGGSVEAASE